MKVYVGCMFKFHIQLYIEEISKHFRIHDSTMQMKEGSSSFQEPKNTKKESDVSDVLEEKHSISC